MLVYFRAILVYYRNQSSRCDVSLYLVSTNKLKQMDPIIIIGAGITGCVITHGLARRGYKVILIEKDAQIGGLTKTFQYGDFSFDIGPHRFYSQKEELSNFIINILKDDYAIISRQSEVYFLGKYYPWPLRPMVFFDLPLAITLKSGWDLVYMNIKNKKKETDTFENYVLMNYGPSLYNIFFKDYTQKFLGLSPKEVHSDWAREGMRKTIIDESIASRNLFDILKLFFIFRPFKTEFIYPTEGTGVFCKRLAKEVKEYGGEIWTDTVITHIKYSSEKIEEIFLKGSGIKPQTLVWTGSLKEICKLLNLPCTGLEYLSLLLFNIEINRPAGKSYQWCYYGSKEIIFSRVTIPSLFNRNMAPEGKTGLCVEVTCREGDQRWNNPETLVERVKKDLIKVGLVGQFKDIRNIHIEKISNAYPIYSRNYPCDLKKVKENLSKFKNLILAGRTGLFWYNNMDNSIENGLEVTREIIQGIK